MEKLKHPSRRSFLIGAGIGGAAAVAAAGAKTLQRATVPTKPSESARQPISEHARKYYRTTRI
jgi:hypothetical protein